MHFDQQIQRVLLFEMLPKVNLLLLRLWADRRDGYSAALTHWFCDAGFKCDPCRNERSKKKSIMTPSRDPVTKTAYNCPYLPLNQTFLTDMCSEMIVWVITLRTFFEIDPFLFDGCYNREIPSYHVSFIVKLWHFPF